MSENGESAACPARPCAELAAALLTGVGHVAIEVSCDGLRGAAESLDRPQHVYNLVAVAGWGAYLAWRVVRGRAVASSWGFRRAGFVASLRASSVFGLPALVGLAAFGVATSRFPPPASFWLLVGVYPAWGLAQQFVLQVLVTRNLRGFVPSLSARAGAAAVLFSAAHFPNAELMSLTFVAGVAFSLVYEKFRNLWAVGIVHGLLGAAAYWFVLGEDAGGAVLSLVERVW